MVFALDGELTVGEQPGILRSIIQLRSLT
jgi:hypothetical protein